MSNQISQQISFLIPQFHLSEDSEDVDDSFYEQQGTVEEVLLLGPQVPMAVKLSQYPTNQDRICLELVHLHATRDHIVLMDPRMMQIQVQEELALRQSVTETLEHFLGTEGEFFPHRWIYPAKAFAELKTHTPLQATGLNIDIWMPKDQNSTGLAKKWRQLQNEIQMIWHDHPVNQEREAKGQLSVNSVWLYGIGQESQIVPHPILQDVTKIYSQHPILLDDRMVSLSMSNIPDFGSMAHHHHFIFAQDLSPSDWQGWWSSCFEALAEKKLQQIQLLKMHQGILHQHRLTPDDIKLNFWKKLLPQKNSIPAGLSDWMEYSKKLSWIPL